MAAGSSNALLSLAQIPNKGRAFVAPRSIPPGQLLLSVLPYAAVPDCQHLSVVCSHCICRMPNLPDAEQTTIRCAECHVAHYCSYICREQDWNWQHDLECAFVKKLHHRPADVLGLEERNYSADRSSYVIDYTGLLMRVLVRRCRELQGELGDSAPYAISGNKNSSIATFTDVWAMISNADCFSIERLHEFERVARFLASFVEAKLFPLLPSNTTFLPAPSSSLGNSSKALISSLRELVCKEECNSFGLYTFDYKGPCHPRQPYGLALYTPAEIFNHSCIPTVGHVTRPYMGTNIDDERRKFLGSHAEMSFFSYSQLNEGDEATISYVDVSDESPDCGETGGNRRRILKDWLCFDCDCRRCEDDKRGLNSGGGKGPNHIICGLDGCRGFLVPRSLMNQGSDVAGVSVENNAWVCEACKRHH
ncbi:hypothetical protein SeMB42_g03546 [Synchytrium endobioticum]|uniref:MYND-type domain-containing protein n=1 Tax=Synchytrium endobioticum TaxID=286115 RepID=A0A507CZK1_9FUNG|nr:hypothetical protein SeLEV6574_g04414 [Synchytrium endobioticum]TPX46841.1 hypothetical protein SeMB42_g03546 [Synchytrium endobioticum]